MWPCPISDPGGEPDLRVVAGSAAFVDWHRGARSWADVVSGGEIEVRGSRALARAFPPWNTREPVLA